MEITHRPGVIIVLHLLALPFDVTNAPKSYNREVLKLLFFYLKILKSNFYTHKKLKIYFMLKFNDHTFILSVK